jgi:large subunit ribosomal protein L13
VKHLSYKTAFVGKDKRDSKWYIIDAQGQTVGRLSSKVASILRGKHTAAYTPNQDAGDFVIIINSDKVVFTGQKWQNKTYLRYTGYPGGQRAIQAKDLNVKHPTAILETSIKGMLPKTKLGKAQYKKLFVYATETHPHEAQKPIEIKLEAKN